MSLRLLMIALFAMTSVASARPALYKDARQAMAIARAQGRSSINLIVLTKPGATAAVATRAQSLGGEVRYSAKDVGYLRLRMPIDHANDLAEYNLVEAATVDVDDSIPIRLSADDSSEPEKDWPPRVSDYPLEHPYSPLADLNAEQLRSEHPTWDGRGVTIAVLDGNPDMLLPEFQTAYTLDGKPTAKFADYLNATDPRDDSNLVPQWVDMHAVVKSHEGQVTFGGKTFTVPADVEYHIGFFNEHRFNSPSNGAYINQDIDRDSNPPGDDGLFGVLWNQKTNDVWVDTNHDLSFRDEDALTDYQRRPKFGVFGKDDPQTPVRESIGFAVQTDKKNGFIAINTGFYQHCTEIMGAVVGNREPHGRIEGVAPGARMVSIYWGSSIHGMAEGLITAFRKPEVDVVVLEQSVALLSTTYLLADARHPISILIQRLIDRYNKLVFVPGDNMPAFAFVAEDGTAPGAVSVGGYQSRESYRLNTGLVPESEDNLHFGALSHGPSTAGALKPDLLAPSGQMSTDPGFRNGQSISGLFQLPPGYYIGSGTSTATPTAAGATALIISAAKQSGIHYNARTLKAALTESARYIETLPANAQGSGLIQVAKAIDRLRELQSSELIDISVQAPVVNKLSNEFAIPGVGVGIYEREGWTVGQHRDRKITLTRTSGPLSPLSFTLQWQGNDGTFSSPASIVLPLNKSVELPISIDARKEGAHSAILSLATNGIHGGAARRILNTIVVPYQLTQAAGYSAKLETIPPVATDSSLFVEVPDGVSALTVNASTTGVRLALIGPNRDTKWLSGCLGDDDHKKPSCTVSRPMAGVWEINVSRLAAHKFNPDAPIPSKATPVTLTASLLDVSVATPQEGSLNLLNRLGKVEAQVTSAPLGSAFEAHPSISQGEQQWYVVDVPRGTTSLSAKLQHPSDAAADLDLYLLDCSTPEPMPGDLKPTNEAPPMAAPLCAVRAKNDEPGTAAKVEFPNPHPGRWVVVVDAYRVPARHTTYDFLDVFSHPKFGTFAVTDTSGERLPAQGWSAKSHLWTAAAPEAPRKLWIHAPVTSVAVTQPVRVKDGFDLDGLISWPVPLGTLDEVATPAASPRKSD